MSQPIKAAVSRMTRLLLVFAMVLSLVGGLLFSAQAKSVYNIKADSNVITTVEGISADTDSPVVDQILEQAGIEVGSSDVVEVTVTSVEESTDDEADASQQAETSEGAPSSSSDASAPDNADTDASSSSSFGAGVASEQVVQAITGDVSTAEDESGDAEQDSKEQDKDAKNDSGSSSDEQKSEDKSDDSEAASGKSQDAEQQEQEALSGSLAEVKARDTEIPQGESSESTPAAESSAPADEQSDEQEQPAASEESEQSDGKQSKDEKSKDEKSGDEQKKDSAGQKVKKEKSSEAAKSEKSKDSEKPKETKKSEESKDEKKSEESKGSKESKETEQSEESKAEKQSAEASSAESAEEEAQQPSEAEERGDSEEKAETSTPDESAQSSGDKIITVTVTRPKYVTVTVDKTLTSVQLQPGDTVRDVIERLNIVLGENDLVSQELDAEPDVSAPITINRVELSYFEKVKTKEFGTVRKPDPKKYIGTEYVKREGVPYKKVDTYEKKVIDGGKPIITKIKTDITEMKDEIVCYGTKVDSPSPSGLSASHNVITNRDEENGTITLSDGSTYSYYSVSDSFAATAYCGGGTTSTGRAAQVGVVAVDPSVIPYGTRMYITSGSIVYGVCVAGDTGVRGHLIDLYFNSASHCRAFGRRGITVYFLD